jgi:hypothetical protein
MIVLRERFNDVWGRTSTDEKIVKHFICNYLFQVKRVDEMFVIIYKHYVTTLIMIANSLICEI